MLTGTGHRSRGERTSKLSPGAWLYVAAVVAAAVAALGQALGADPDIDGPVRALVVGATSLVSVRRGLDLTQRMFNASMYGLSAWAAGETYLALGGPVGHPSHQ